VCYSLWYNAPTMLPATSCNTQSNAPEDGQNNCPKHDELTGIINKPLLLHLLGCLYNLYQWCTVEQKPDNEMYVLIKYIKSVLWRVAKHLSYIEDARCLKVNILPVVVQLFVTSFVPPYKQKKWLQTVFRDISYWEQSQT